MILRSSISAFILVVAFCIISAAKLHAHLGIIEGYVSDSAASQPLSGASVMIESERKGMLTNELGRFRMANLAAGTYEVKISFVGFHSKTFTVQVRENEITEIKAALSVSVFQLSDVVITDNNTSSLRAITDIDMALYSVQSAQDLLPMVPGLFIAQHAGGGKAEQIFLRGFDLDHGTDINLSVDGMPVNMVSHAHGQGYADLHFVIPEAVERIDFVKGPYYAKYGNLATAGAVELSTKDYIDRSQLKIEGGQFGTYRTVGLFNLLGNGAEKRDKLQSAFVAVEYMYSDAYFDASQNLDRANIMGKYTVQVSDRTRIGLSLSSFSSKWDASGQIPGRAVDSIGRFGAIDATEGGITGRRNVNLTATTILDNGALVRNQVYFSNYDFKLYSNFTFFLNDSINGDQIRQQENRNLYGYKGSYAWEQKIGPFVLRSVLGLGFRKDDIGSISLSATQKRSFLYDYKNGSIDETNAYAFADETLVLSRRWSVTAALRADAFRFSYVDELNPEFQRKVNEKSILNPMLRIQYEPVSNVQIYLNGGSGFHSNDSRGVVSDATLKTLPRALGADFGATVKLLDRFIVNAALWTLHMEQEFVYVGDEGVIEPKGASIRQGVDLSIRGQITPWLFAYTDLTACTARFVEEIDEMPGANRIPLAPVLTNTGGLTMNYRKRTTASLRYRYLGDRPANEANTTTATGYFLMDAAVNYTWSNYQLGLTVQNLFDQQWNEAQFDTESRLANESAPVSEIHFTPGTPRFIRLSFSVFF